MFGMYHRGCFLVVGFKGTYIIVIASIVLNLANSIGLTKTRSMHYITPVELWYGINWKILFQVFFLPHYTTSYSFVNRRFNFGCTLK